MKGSFFDEASNSGLTATTPFSAIVAGEQQVNNGARSWGPGSLRPGYRQRGVANFTFRVVYGALSPMPAGRQRPS